LPRLKGTRDIQKRQVHPSLRTRHWKVGSKKTKIFTTKKTLGEMRGQRTKTLTGCRLQREKTTKGMNKKEGTIGIA